MVCPVQTAAIVPSIIQITLSWLKKPKSPGRSAWIRPVTAAHPVRVLPGRFSRKAKSETSPWHGRNPIAQGQLGDPLRRVNQFMLIFSGDFCAGYGECGREIFVSARCCPSQVRKNANQITPRIKTARPVETTSRASTDGPGSACRASVGVSTIWRCCRVAMGALDSLNVTPEAVRSFGARYREQRMISDHVPVLGPANVRERHLGKNAALSQFAPDPAPLSIRLRNHRLPSRLTPLGDSAPGLI
jgi:hypothetical protein